MICSFYPGPLIIFGRNAYLQLFIIDPRVSINHNNSSLHACYSCIHELHSVMCHCMHSVDHCLPKQSELTYLYIFWNFILRTYPTLKIIIIIILTPVCILECSLIVQYCIHPLYCRDLYQILLKRRTWKNSTIHYWLL